MIDTERLYRDQLTPEGIERERLLLAYEMTKGHLRHNRTLLGGDQPVDAEGEPLFVSYKSDAQIGELVAQAYGRDQRVVDAINAAYTQHYKELLERNN